MGHRGACYDDEGMIDCVCAIGEIHEFVVDGPTDDDVAEMMETFEEGL